MMNLSKLVKMSNTYGGNEDYVLAGGGNTSVKDESTLYVKCSGTQLATITADGFVAMDRAGLDEILLKKYPEGDSERESAYLADVMKTITDPDKTKRPSVEALLHNLFPHTYVLHVHPALINGLTCSVGGAKLCAELLGDDVLWIDACRPGYTLARICADEMAKREGQTGRKPQILLLQNHGIFVAANTVKEIDTLFGGVIDKLKKNLKRTPDLSPLDGDEAEAAKKAAEELAGASGKNIKIVDAKEALSFSGCPHCAAPLMKPFTPDHIVYCGPYPLFIESVAEYKEKQGEQVEKTGFVPKIVIIKGKGIFAVGEKSADCEKPAMLIRDAIKIAVYAESFGGASPLGDDLIDFITHWEAESYRSKQ